MAEYIGSRISLISKRDIRYVGTLHEISSENSTVALEQVVSFGTEDRNATPGEFVPPSDNVYEYIVFRGSDVKDLRIEKEPEKKPPQAPQIPDDPAILGNSRPAGSAPAPAAKQDEKPVQEPGTRQPQQPPQFHEQQQPPPPQQYGQQWMNNYPPNQRFGPRDAPGFPPYGHPGMHYGPPPGWYGPPDRGFPQGHPGQFQPPHHMQQGPFPPHQGGPQRPPSKPNTPAEVMASQPPPKPTAASEKQAATVKLPGSTTTPGSVPAGEAAPPPPAESKPDVAAALAPPSGAGSTNAAASSNSGGAKGAPAITKSGRIQPAVPILAGQKPKAPVNGVGSSKPAEGKAKPSSGPPGQASAKSYEDANADARAAVAAAMANLAPQSQAKQTNGDAGGADNLTKKFNEMRTDDYAAAARAASGAYGSGHRGGRGLHRGGRPRTESHGKKIEVPKTDYDFATANAKFNKQDLLKEASTGGSPSAGTPAESVTNEASAPDGSSQDQVVIPPPVYSKTASFFDNISSESRDREETGSKRLGGREFRSEETKKNLETFGQGSVDGRRGGFRGRGRGRGARGGRGRGAFRGRGDAVVTEV